MLNVKEAIRDMGGADVVAKLIPGATKNIVYHWSSANRVGSAFLPAVPGTVQQDEGQGRSDQGDEWG